jgi:polar amino acid transport system substrate-binding protein
MTTLRTVIIALLVCCLFFGACGKSEDPEAFQKIESEPLRIGMSPNSPPMIFMLDGRYAGVEADFARLLARKFGQAVYFLPMGWDQLIPALMEGKVDLIMSGMTATQARQMRIRFTDPYFKARLVVAMRAEDANKYDSREKILETPGNVGVNPGTTADAFVQNNLANARRVAIAEVHHAAQEFKNKRIDLFMSDGPGIVWLVSENEAELVGFWEGFSEDPLAWGVRRDNEELLNSVNSILATWKTDGTVEKVLMRWLPYLERIK